MNQSEQWQRAALVARRLSLGTTGTEVDAIVREGLDRWVERVLAPQAVASYADRTRRSMPSLPAARATGKDAPAQERKARNKELRQGADRATDWWLDHLAATDVPVLEKVVWGWHDHFATSVVKVKDARLMLQQNHTLRRLALGSFTDLARAILVDPAMLRWLDGAKNVKGAPNENLAREFMELFTLGVDGGYTEQDVREAARALTGWRVTSEGTARLRPGARDTGSVTVLGRRGTLDAAGLADLVLARPASSRYVITQWWRRLGAPTDPSSATAARLLAAYGPRRDVAALLRAVALDPELPRTAGTQVKAPVEWWVGAQRTLHARVPSDMATRRRTLLAGLGQVPFHPPSVGGWPGGPAWLSSASARLRDVAAGQLVATADLSVVERSGRTDRVDQTAHLLGLPGFSERTTRALRPVIGDPRELVRLALVSPDYLVS